MKNNLDKFNRLIEERLFFEAHEALEPLWLAFKKEGNVLTPLLRGYINAAIAFEHIKRGGIASRKSAKKTFACYLRYRHLSSKCDNCHQTTAILDKVANLFKL